MVQQQDPLETVSVWVDAFCEQLLRPYNGRLKRTGALADSREINDPVWATISLTPFESVIVDSPLFQRLRRIRQLGVVHWVYPGAIHTRFEHSLGALHQVQQLIESINRGAGDSEGLAINAERAALLRACALCHDLGYGAMSHVFENAVIADATVQAILLQFGRKHRIEPPSFSEIIVYYMLGAPAFAEMVVLARGVARPPHPPADFVARAQKVITGQIVYDEMPLLQELISGPFDADKLDYMQRDALMSGIPAITDVPRLIRKVRARWTERRNLPPRVARRVTELSRYLIFGVAFSGSRTLDELLIARVLLFDKVYRHQKVRAIEGMVARLLDALAAMYKGERFRIPFLFSDDTVLEADVAIANLESFEPKADTASLGIVRDLCSRLRDRRLFERAFVFAMHFPEIDGNSETHRGMGRFIDEAEGARAESLLRDIATEIIKLANSLGQSLDAFPDQSLRSHLWLDAPTKRDHGEKVSNAFLLKLGDDIIRYSDHSKEVPHWAQAYLAKKDVGFLFCVPELQNFTFLATEKLVAQRFGFRVPGSALAYLKLVDRELNDLRQRLHDNRYYASVPFATRPWRPRLKAPDVELVSDSVIQNLKGYSGPPAGPDNEYPNISINRIRSWLAQFDDDALIDFALRVIKKIRLFGRTEVSASVKAFLARNDRFKEAIAVALGDARDSGSVVAYLAQDVGIEAKPLEEALACGRPIVFVDDCIGSGGQADNIVADWFDRQKEHDLHESKRLTLTPEQQATLKHAPTAFVFCTGLTTGVEHLEKQCREFELDASITVGFRDRELPSLFDQDLAREESHEDFVAACRRIGEVVLKDTHPEWDLSKITERALGYGNKGLLITFPFNTPAQTLTCLWAEGAYQSSPWKPLLPRRIKH